MNKDPKIDPDDDYPKPGEITRLADHPSFDPKAHPHLHFLAHATLSLESGKISHFQEPENLKKFRSAKDYAASDEKHAAHVQGELDKFMQRPQGAHCEQSLVP